MHEAYDRHQKQSSQTSSGNIGLLLGTLGLVAGTAWCLRNHGGDRSRHLNPDRTSHQRNWLLGALGAGLAGAALGTTGYRSRKVDARGQSGDIRLASHVTINRSPEEVYQYWRNFQNLPQVMSFIERVEPQEGKIYHWVARGPAGPAIEWDAEVVDDDPGKLLAWRSLEGSDLQTWGTVIFRPREGNLGTELSVAFNFCPPDRATGVVLRYLSGLENAVLDKNLKDLKAQLEAGEVPSGRRFSTSGNAIGKGQAL